MEGEIEGGGETDVLPLQQRIQTGHMQRGKERRKNECQTAEKEKRGRRGREGESGVERK